MLDVPILDVMKRARKQLEHDQPFWLKHRVVITAYAGGRSVNDPIDVVLIVHFDREDNPISDRYALFKTEMLLNLDKTCLQRAHGRYFLPAQF